MPKNNIQQNLTNQGVQGGPGAAPVQRPVQQPVQQPVQPVQQPVQQPQQPVQHPVQQPAQQPQKQNKKPAPIRKKGSSNAILIIVILVAVIAVIVLAVTVLPGACARMDDAGDPNINVVNTEGSALSEKQIVDRAKERYAGTWSISSVTWQGEDGDASQIPQKVVIDADGKCTVTQGDGEYKGSWEIDGDSLYVTAESSDGKSIAKILSIDNNNLSISTNNGTGIYVRTAKPNLDTESK